MSYRTANRLLTGAFALCLGLLAVGCLVNRLAFFYLALAVMAAAAGTHLRFCRCPRCRRHLSRADTGQCPFCGEDMDETDA